MSDAVELAVCYIQLVPSLAGSQGKIVEEIVPELTKGGDTAGKAFGSKFKAAVGGVDYKSIGLGAAGALAAGFGGLVAVGGVFDDLGDTIRTKTGASGEALDGLVSSAKAVGARVPAEFGKIGPTVAELNTRLGLSGENLELVAAQYLEAGRVLGKDVDVRKTSAAFAAFGIEGDNVSGAMDALFRVSQSTGVGMDELGATVAKNGAAMQSLGFDFGETAALAGVLDKAGINSNKTMGAMGKALVTLAKDGEKPQDAFKRVTGEIGALVAKGDEAGAINLAAKLFGAKGAPQMIQALKDGTLSAESLSTALNGSGDTILGVGGDTADFAESFQILKNNAALALEPLASTVFSGLSDTLAAMLPSLTAFGAWLADNQWVLGVVAGIIGGVMVGSFVAWAASVWAANAALLANPVTWIVLAIVALIAGLVLLIANWDAVASWLSGVWSGIVTAVGDGWNALVGWLSDGMTAISEGMAAGWSAISEATGEAWSAIVDFFAATWSTIVDGVTGFAASVVGFFAGLWSTVVAGVTGFGASVAGFLVGLWSKVSSGVVSFAASVVGFFVGLWSKVSSGASGFGSAIIGFLAGVWSTLYGAVSGFGSNLLGFLAGVWSGLNSAAQSTWSIIVGFVTGQPAKIFAGLASLGGLGAKALAWFGGMASAASTKFGELLTMAGGIPGKIGAAFGNLGSMLEGSGRALLQGFARGISEGVGRAISAAKDALGAIRNLFPFSPPKDPRSPFAGRAYTTHSGAALIADFAKGVDAGASAARRDVIGALDGVVISALPEQPITARADAAIGVASSGGDTWHVDLRAEDLDGLKTIEEFIETARRKRRAGVGG